MCTGFEAALLAGMAGSTYMQHEQARKQEKNMKESAEEAKRKAAAEKNAQESNTLSEASPLLIKQGGKSSKGLSQLKVAGSNAGGYNALGMGGNKATGLNIANG